LPQALLAAPFALVTKVVTAFGSELAVDEDPPPQANKPNATEVSKVIKTRCFLLILMLTLGPYVKNN